ncbi:MAG: NAD(P)/FAD-dependent oxidoreductase [Gammaproteobacteria bacterium]
MDTSNPTRIVIVGGGAGGFELATRLGRRHGRDPAFEITLVDKSYTHLWKPLLHEVAAGSLNSYEDEMSYIAHAHWHHFHFKLGALKALDRARRQITIAASHDADGNEYIPERTLPYDYLVIAIGSVTNDFGVDGVAEHCFFLDSREQADHFHQSLLRTCYAANAQSEPVRPGQLHVAIAGAGATGVELAAELHSSLHEMVEFGLDKIDVERDVHIHLVEGAERILPGLPERVSASTRSVLERIGVTVHTGQRITRATAAGFETADGTEIAAEIKVWAAGIRAPEVLAELDGLESNHINQLVVRSTLQTLADDRIFALGDCAACPMPDSDRTVPPRAQAAHQQASHVAGAIEKLLAGRPVPDYRYKDFGSLVNLSVHSAVGNLMGNLFRNRSASVPLEGRLARWAYLSLYKMHQLAVNGLLRTAATTIADMLTRGSKPRLKLH